MAAFEDPWFREGKSVSPLDVERRLYQQTKNALHAWRALAICSRRMRAGTYANDTLPVWVMDYFDGGEEGINQLFIDAAADGITDLQVAARLAEALGFKLMGQGVRTSAFTRTALEHRRRALASMVWSSRREHPSRSIESIALELEEQLGTAAAAFEQRRRAGEIPAAARPSEHELRASKETIETAWREWRAFLDDELSS